MRRRQFITFLGGAAVAWPLASRAQANIYTIGVLAIANPSPAPLLNALREGMREAGYIEGQNLRLEVRMADAGPMFAEEAAELVHLKVEPYSHILHAGRVGSETGNDRNTNRNGRRGRSGRDRYRRQFRPTGRQHHRIIERRRGGRR